MLSGVKSRDVTAMADKIQTLPMRLARGLACHMV